MEIKTELYLKLFPVVSLGFGFEQAKTCLGDLKLVYSGGVFPAYTRCNHNLHTNCNIRIACPSL